MSQSPLARRYARALFELCQESKGQTAPAVIAKQLESFGATLEGAPELRAVLKSGALLQDKKEILNKIFARFLFAPTTRNFLFVVLEAGRIDLTPEIVLAFGELLDEASGRLRASVTSAIPLDKAELTRIQSALQRLTGKQVTLDARVDPAILGGVITTVGNTVLDGSVRTQLAALRDRLHQTL